MEPPASPTPPFRAAEDPVLSRIVESVREVLDPDAVEIEVHFRPGKLKYRRRFLRERVSTVRPLRPVSRPAASPLRLELPFQCADVVSGKLLLIRRTPRPWTGPEILRFELLSPFAAQLLELAARSEMDGGAPRRLPPLAPGEMKPRLRSIGLSEREAEVVAALLKGLRNAEIARELFITEWTVKDHLKHVFVKLGVRSRSGLLRALFDETLLS